MDRIQSNDKNTGITSTVLNNGQSPRSCSNCEEQIIDEVCESCQHDNYYNMPSILSSKSAYSISRRYFGDSIYDGLPILKKLSFNKKKDYVFNLLKRLDQILSSLYLRGQREDIIYLIECRTIISEVIDLDPNNKRIDQILANYSDFKAIDELELQKGLCFDQKQYSLINNRLLNKEYILGLRYSFLIFMVINFIVLIGIVLEITK